MTTLRAADRFVTFIFTHNQPQSHVESVFYVKMQPFPIHRHTPSALDMPISHIPDDDECHECGSGQEGVPRSTKPVSEGEGTIKNLG